jgi:uncharacterized membrane protein (DUF485 family)
MARQRKPAARAKSPPSAGATAHGSRRTARADAEQRLRTLARDRTRIGLVLTALVFAVYFGFIGAVAYARPQLGTLVVPGLSVGILAGALVIVAAWLLTWAYVHWANTRYDPALQALRER